jgi:IS1 family transposase
MYYFQNMMPNTPCFISHKKINISNGILKSELKDIQRLEKCIFTLCYMCKYETLICEANMWQNWCKSNHAI